MSHTPPDLPGSAATIGLTIDTVLRRTDKTLLARGSFRGEPAAVKYLIDPDSFWAARWRHELDVYEVFGDNIPPVRVPRLLHTDRDRLLVLEWFDASPLAVERYPQRKVDTREVDAVLDCITALNEWTYPAARFSPTFDYSERVARYQAKGYLTEGQREALDSLLARCDAPAQLNHGDPLASNILLDAGRSDSDDEAETTAVLVDWEFTGLFLPGFDLAMLHTQVGASTPVIRERIEAIVSETGIEAAFALNLAVILTRELRLHHELPEDDPTRMRCLPIIEAAWTSASTRLQRVTAARSA
ncbi:phosphotransferase family protein [Micromonospora sp. bgisy143]|uniref:phosphotransferase family protein n=1 Tax=Micromonospora sp. bgisy143 TaxID=3413790 RepID=UPI003EBC5852